MLVDAFTILTQLDVYRLAGMFWYALVMEIPRFTLGLVVVSGCFLHSRPLRTHLFGSLCHRLFIIQSIYHANAYGLGLCVDEFFLRSSYRDTFVPSRVLKRKP
jgi:hypothetical protein